ncbi:MAG: biotin/lipoyl-binding protein [Clostridiales bacterium]|nr:biotin/lipoyl-binding protein [Clostridiales bacterium]
MRKFKININGNSYEVEVEELEVDYSSVQTSVIAKPPIQQTTDQPSAASTASVKPTASSELAVKPSPTPIGHVGSIQVKAPMPGNILDIRVKEGDMIKKGQVVMILEAMKMENEIMPPQDGNIASINISVGAVVNSGDLLFSIK